MPEHSSMYQRVRSLALIASAAVGAWALLVLLGWCLDSAVLKSGIPGLVAMNPVTAVLFLCSAVALALSTCQAPSRRRRFVVSGLSLLIIVAGLVSFGQYASLWNLQIDRALFADALGEDRMAPNTALQFILLGMALLTLDPGASGLRSLSPTLTLVVLVGALMSLVGYAYGARYLYGIGAHIPMALNTAALFEAMALGLLCIRPDRSVFAVLASPGAGGAVARRLLPAALIIPVVLGFVRVMGQRAGLYDTEFGAALMVIATVVLLVAAIVTTASTLDRTDAERRQAEQALRESAERYRFMGDAMPQMVWTARPDGHVDYYNQRWYEYTGMTFEQCTGWGWKPVLHPDDVEHCVNRWNESLETGEPYQIEYRFKRAADGAYRWHLGRALPKRNQQGEIIQWVGTCTDIDDQKRAEQQIRKLNNELEQRVAERTADLEAANRDLAHKNQENEMFVYSVSHDLRSPLVSLQGFSNELNATAEELRQLLNQDAVSPETGAQAIALVDGDMRQSIQFIQTAALRLSRIIDALLRLSRVGRVEYCDQTLDMNVLLQRLVASLGGELFEKGASISVATVPPCQGDPTAVEQLFGNLISNALKYLSPHRAGIIEVGCSPNDRSQEAGTQTYFVRDNGLGIPQAHQDKIFHAFKRAHPEIATGEGMGLAIVKRIVERHGGHVWVESTEGQGSTFFVRLPSPESSEDVVSMTQDSIRKGFTHDNRTDGHLVGGRR